MSVIKSVPPKMLWEEANVEICGNDGKNSYSWMVISFVFGGTDHHYHSPGFMRTIITILYLEINSALKKRLDLTSTKRPI